MPSEPVSRARRWVEPFHGPTHLIPHQPCQVGRNCCARVKDEDTEAPSRPVTGPGSHRQVWGLGPELGSLTLQ